MGAKRTSSYGVYVRFRKTRLTLARGLKTQDEAMAFAERARAARLRDRDAVIVMKEPEGLLVEVPWQGAIEAPPSSDGIVAPLDSRIVVVAPSACAPARLDSAGRDAGDGLVSDEWSFQRAVATAGLSAQAPTLSIAREMQKSRELMRAMMARTSEMVVHQILTRRRERAAIARADAAHDRLGAAIEHLLALPPTDDPLVLRARELARQTRALLEQRRAGTRQLERIIDEAEARSNYRERPASAPASDRPTPVPDAA